MEEEPYTISASKISCFKKCRRDFELTYIEGLEPAQKHSTLAIGSKYHEDLEQYLLGKITSSDNYLVQAFINHIDISSWEDITTEEYKNSGLSHDIRLNSITDAKTSVNKRRYIVEHKTTSQKIDEQLEYDLQWDDQIPIYCGLEETYDVLYTVIKKCTLRLKKNQTEAEFFKERVNWYKTDTESKIRCFKFPVSKERVTKHREETLELARHMRDTKLFYRNKTACNMFGGCKHKSYCLTHQKGELPLGCVRNKYYKGEE